LVKAKQKKHTILQSLLDGQLHMTKCK